MRGIARPMTTSHLHVAPSSLMYGRGMIRLGGVRLLTPRGPAGPVGPIPGTDLPYQGMDPSDPKTYIRPYNPQPGMISYLNRDGAQPNPAGGVQRGRPPAWLRKAARGRGGVAGSSGNNG